MLKVTLSKRIEPVAPVAPSSVMRSVANPFSMASMAERSNDFNSHAVVLAPNDAAVLQPRPFQYSMRLSAKPVVEQLVPGLFPNLRVVRLHHRSPEPLLVLWRGGW